MAIHKSKSRVQFLGRNKQGRRKEKLALEPSRRKHAKVTVENTEEGTKGLPKVSPGIYGSRELTSRTPSFFDENGSDSTYYEDTDEEDVTSEVPSFPKQRFPSTEEISLSGQFKSELRTTMTYSCVSTTKNDAINPAPSIVEVESTNSPSDSLLIQPPVFVPTAEELDAVPRTLPPRPRNLEHSSPSTSVLQKVVNLITRHKNASEDEKQKKGGTPDPTSGFSAWGLVLELEDRVAAYGKASIPTSMPRLTHAQTIPPIRVTGVEHLSHRPGYEEIMPAPEHRYMGLASVAQDMYKPMIVQRDFESVNKSSPRPLKDRRSHSAAKLLDRNGDTWPN